MPKRLVVSNAGLWTAKIRADVLLQKKPGGPASNNKIMLHIIIITSVHRSTIFKLKILRPNVLKYVSCVVQNDSQ